MDDTLDGFVPYKKETRNSGLKNEFTGKPGCYVFTDVVIGDHYVGSSTDLPRRIRTNLSNLNHNKHSNRNLQAAYNKNPDVEIWVQPTDTGEQARQLEQETVNKFLPTGKLHNVGTDDVTRPGVGVTRSEEQRKRISDAHLGHKVSEETRLKIRDTHLGMTLSEEAKQKISTAQKERHSTNEGKAAHAKGREKLKKPVECYGVIYPSVTEAAKTLGVHYTTIIQRCNSDKYPNFIKINKST